MIPTPEVIARIHSVRRALYSQLHQAALNGWKLDSFPLGKTHEGAIHAWGEPGAWDWNRGRTVELTKQGGRLSWTSEDTAPSELNGIPFAPVSTLSDLSGLVNSQLAEAPFSGTSAGLILVEPDGRVWTVSPQNQFGGTLNTFPKGQLHDHETPQEAAIRETWEESGLVGKVDRLLGDFHRHRRMTRYYLAHRIAGAPWAMGWESERVNLVPLDQLEADFHNARGEVTADHLVADALTTSMVKTHQGAINAWITRRRKLEEEKKQAEAKPAAEPGLQAGEQWMEFNGRKVGVNPADPLQMAMAALPAKVHSSFVYNAPVLPELADAQKAIEFWTDTGTQSNTLSWAVAVYRQGGQEALDKWVNDKSQVPSHLYGSDIDAIKQAAARHVKGLMTALDHAPVETLPTIRSLTSQDLDKIGKLKPGDEFAFNGPKAFSHEPNMKGFNTHAVLEIDGPVRGVNVLGFDQTHPGEEEMLALGKFRITKIEDVPAEAQYWGSPQLEHHITAHYVGKRGQKLRVIHIAQVSTAFASDVPDLTRAIAASVRKIAKSYSIHDLRPDLTRVERREATADLLMRCSHPEVLRDIESAGAYSPFVPWSRAVSDASHAYLREGDAGLRQWQDQHGADKAYQFDYQPAGLRLDGAPLGSSAEVAVRVAKRMIEQVRAAPVRELELYRGLHGNRPIASLEVLKAGDTLRLDRLVSFSAHATIALRFAERGKALNHEYVLKIIGPARGIALDALADRDQGEFVTEGEFRVEQVERQEAGYVRPSGLSYPVERVTITVRQVKVY